MDPFSKTEGSGLWADGSDPNTHTSISAPMVESTHAFAHEGSSLILPQSKSNVPASANAEPEFPWQLLSTPSSAPISPTVGSRLPPGYLPPEPLRTVFEVVRDKGTPESAVGLQIRPRYETGKVPKRGTKKEEKSPCVTRAAAKEKAFE
jgi:hypothetical protein